MTARMTWVGTAVLSAFIAVPTTGSAQDYPTKPVRVIVVFPPGGSNDVTARIVFQKMPEITGQQFIVDNRGGASGSLGAAVVAASPADGYTVMVQSTTHIANAFMFKDKLQYDTLGDFIGVTPLARQVAMLTVHPSLPAKSVKAFIDLAKARPNEVNYGSAGLGSYLHLCMAKLASMTGMKLVHVPFRGGGPMLTGLVSGEVTAAVATIGSAYPHIKAGRIRPLGVTAPERMKQFPDVPAIAEAVPGYEFTAWVGSFVPKGTPKPIVDKLNADLKRALSDPEVSKRLETLTLDPLYMTPAQFDARLKSDYQRYGELMREVGVVK